jgi:hypothetical protein
MVGGTVRVVHGGLSMRFSSVLAATALLAVLFCLSTPTLAGSPPVEVSAEFQTQCVGNACSTSPRRSVVHHSAPRRVVVKQTNNITVVNGSAQADAETMASTGVMRHLGHNNGCREGIGFSTASADDAIRRCCYYGRYRAREIGVARGSRGWFACVRYE